MIKRTLYFGNPAYLKTKNEQLIVELPETSEVKTAAIEDIGLLILDHAQITITQPVLGKLLENNTAVITCNHTHHPVGLFLNLDGHTLQSQRFKHQLAASVPLQKQLWQQTVMAKITNQANLLAQKRIANKALINLVSKVKSGDSDNCEAQAAAYYWKHIFPEFLNFKRFREGEPPNNLLNYGYAILRAVVARSLVGSGLLPTLGIHHRNQYNAYCLADDVMEPYRPYVDKVVCDIVRNNGNFLEMTPSMKQQLLSIPAMDVMMNDEKAR
ncbi:type II CRISPR-associated endonuclease Cas1 [Niabella ginsengisoli]|uniref:CRISPR-associated endonuclease Cas1 n=1 Tax=Niabella ginsengisoli TaxID=522298 RepID=A0ABS9SMI8_9BACT|nr:type II CRISPR-associated endonuclease Cas1 [Niabella ginsengisoli]MCH5599595.1 type II CRISPR-associated endonuclease Cas1 [Niabella ginsengisoli]